MLSFLLPFGSFPHKKVSLPVAENITIAFYSLLGVSNPIVFRGIWITRPRFLLPFGSFRLSMVRWLYYLVRLQTFYSLLGVSELVSVVCRDLKELHRLSTPFWEFLVRVLFKIFLSLSLKAFMKVIGTFVIS